MSTTDPFATTMETSARWREAPAPEVVAQLQNLIQVYAVMTDTGRAEELESLFTSDASWNGEELGYGSAHGPADIAATVLAHFNPDRPMMHVPGPALLVAIDDREVHGVSWCLATRRIGRRQRSPHLVHVRRRLPTETTASGGSPPARCTCASAPAAEADWRTNASSSSGQGCQASPPPSGVRSAAGRSPSSSRRTSSGVPRRTPADRCGSAPTTWQRGKASTTTSSERSATCGRSPVRTPSCWTSGRCSAGCTPRQWPCGTGRPWVR